MRTLFVWGRIGTFPGAKSEGSSRAFAPHTFLLAEVFPASRFEFVSDPFEIAHENDS